MSHLDSLDIIERDLNRLDLEVLNALRQLRHLHQTSDPYVVHAAEHQSMCDLPAEIMEAQDRFLRLLRDREMLKARLEAQWDKWRKQKEANDACPK